MLERLDAIVAMGALFRSNQEHSVSVTSHADVQIRYDDIIIKKGNRRKYGRLTSDKSQLESRLKRLA